MAASSFVRVAFRDNPAVSVHLDGKILTYWDVAKAAANEHLGKTAAADVGAGAVALRGPVTTGSEDEARALLAGCDKKKLSDKVGSPFEVHLYEAWFLLEISSAGWRT